MMHIDWADPDLWLSLATLTAMEIVLGIDNIIFIAILTGRLPPERQARARKLGLSLALLTRLGLLFTISWVMGLTNPLFTLIRPISGRDLILLFGGAFLIAKATREIHAKLEVPSGHAAKGGAGVPSMAAVLVQIALLDVVFSLDSVITAVGMADEVWVMAAAMILAVGVMLVFSGKVSGFVDQNPTIKILALSFLILIGVMLVAEGLGQHISKGYVYFAMAFSLGVELVNMRARKAQHLKLNPNAPEP